MGVITRVAGNGNLGNSGDGGPATDAELYFPVAMASTGDGGFLVSDSGNNEVRAVSAGGVITRVAGNGTAGSGGDGGPATDAQLNSPATVAVTADGGFLIADTDNNMVRKVAGVGPTVTGVSPTTRSGGNTVTVTGTGFTNAIGVTFGTAAASALVVASDITLTVTSPPNPMGTVDVTVTTPAGTSAATAADQFTYI